MRQANVTIHLNERFDDWTVAKQDWLIDRLVLLAGCTVDDISFVSARRGCVLLYIRIPDAAAQRLAEEYKIGLENQNTDEGFLVEGAKAIVAEILKELSVVSIRADVAKPSPFTQTQLQKDRPLFVLVHGWRGSRTSFGELPNIIEEEFDCQVETPEYKTGAFEGADPLYILGNQLTTFINNRSFRKPRDIALIGHSMGGVVSRASLIESLRGHSYHYAEHLKLFVSVASPLSGAWLGSLAKHMPGDFEILKQAAELSANSPTLAEIIKWWNDFENKNLHLKGKIRSIYSNDDKVVPIASAISTDPNAICIGSASHTDIIKPICPDDEIARTIIMLATKAEIT